MNNISSQGGEILSVTTDGFCSSLNEGGLVSNIGSLSSGYLDEMLLKSGLVSKEKICFLTRAREARSKLTLAMGKEDPTVFELKCKVKGMTQWSTRGQVSG